jgi:hypothetical protein
VDDILVMGRTKQTLMDTFVKLKEEAKRYGLVVYEGKTKYMKCGGRKTNENKLEIETMEFKMVLSFKFPGSVVNQTNETEEVKERLNAGNKAFMLTKRCFNVNYYLKDQNLDYTHQQSDQLLHMFVKHGY